MEQQQSSSKRLSRMSKFSVVLSYMVAVFAILSLIAAGFSQISYAAPTTVDDTITFYQATKNGELIYMTPYVDDTHTFVVPYYLGNNPVYGSSDSIRIFCLEHNSPIPQNADNEVYSKSETVNDAGVMYILNKSRVLGGSGIVPQTLIDQIVAQPAYASDDHAVMADIIETYATQAALWVYMHDNYLSTSERFSLEGNGKTDAENYEVIKNAGGIDTTIAGMSAIVTGNLYQIAIQPTVNEANNATNVASVTISRTDKSVSKVGDDGFYQTSAITVSGTPTDKFVSFDVEVSGIDGAFVVDGKGTTKTHFDLSPENADRDEAKFYIRIPVDKVVDTSTLKGTAKVTGQFSGVGAQVYGSATYQRVVQLGGPAEDYDTTPIDFAATPPTGMSKAQTIYFIGLIVLLCGVGIVYANAKPAQSEE